MTDTPRGFPFPPDTARPDVPADLRALAEAVDAATCAGRASASWSGGAADRSMAVTFPAEFRDFVEAVPGTVVVVTFVSGTNAIWLRHVVQNVTAAGCSLLWRGSDPGGGTVTFTAHWTAHAIRPAAG
jgi:hypothetical protein